MEVAAFHPPRCYPQRLVSVALFRAFVAELTATYSGRVLPGIPLCGARTFLPPVSRAATVWLASGPQGYSDLVDAPCDDFAGAQRHDRMVVERILGRYRPRLPLERHFVGV